jgi:hypothetical protein
MVFLEINEKKKANTSMPNVNDAASYETAVT